MASYYASHALLLIFFPSSHVFLLTDSSKSSMILLFLRCLYTNRICSKHSSLWFRTCIMGNSMGIMHFHISEHCFGLPGENRDISTRLWSSHLVFFNVFLNHFLLSRAPPCSPFPSSGSLICTPCKCCIWFSSLNVINISIVAC